MNQSIQERIALAIQVYEKRIANYQKQIESCAKRKDYQNAFRYSIMIDELKDAKLLLEQIAAQHRVQADGAESAANGLVYKIE